MPIHWRVEILFKMKLLDDLPRYIVASPEGMLRLPDYFQARSDVYVKLADVKKLLEETQCQKNQG